MPSARGGAQGKSYVLSAISIFCVNSTTRRAQFEAEDKAVCCCWPGYAVYVAQGSTLPAKVTDRTSSLGLFWNFLQIAVSMSSY